jgi:hypothetical protein
MRAKRTQRRSPRFAVPAYMALLRGASKPKRRLQAARVRAATTYSGPVPIIADGPIETVGFKAGTR